MTVGSSVSLAWGIQIETIPLLFALGAYEASEPARHFFSLLRLRARSSTLIFSPPTSPHHTTIACFPVEVIDEVLAYLHLELQRTARRALIDKVGRCFCQGTKSLYGHGCGIDCSAWWTCSGRSEFAWEEDDLPAWNHDRITKMLREFSDVLDPKISNFASLFNLETIASPTLVNGWLGGGGELSPTIVGIPFPSTINSRGILSTPVSELKPHPEHCEEVSNVASVGGSLRLTRRERRRFKALARVLYLEEHSDVDEDEDSDEEPEDVLEACYLELAPISTESKGRRPGGRRHKNSWLKGGKTSFEPKLMLLHSSFAIW